MRNLDFSSLPGLLSTLLGLAIITLVGVGIRLLVMQTIQQRRERANRQINERLRTLIAAYRTLGGSFTGNLAVDPTHLRDLRLRTSRAATEPPAAGADAPIDHGVILPDPEEQDPRPASERARRVRDAVEAALSDIILLGTGEQVRLAARAAAELASGRPIHTADLVISLRGFIREALDLEPVPADVEIPRQGPTRPQSTRGGGQAGKGGEREGGKDAGGGAGMAGGAGIGLGIGVQSGLHGSPHGGLPRNDAPDSHR